MGLFTRLPGINYVGVRAHLIVAKLFGTSNPTLARREGVSIDREAMPASLAEPAGGAHQCTAQFISDREALVIPVAWSLPACPLRQRRQGSGRAAVSAERTFRCDAVLAVSAPVGLGPGVPRLPLPWHMQAFPAVSSSPWFCIPIKMASRPMASSASPPPWAVAVSPSKSCAPFHLNQPKNRGHGLSLN